MSNPDHEPPASENPQKNEQEKPQEAHDLQENVAHIANLIVERVQQIIPTDDILRTLTVHGDILVTLLAAVRVLMDKGVITQDDLLKYIPDAQQLGTTLLGVAIDHQEDPTPETPTERPSAEERYAAEGLHVWRGDKLH